MEMEQAEWKNKIKKTWPNPQVELDQDRWCIIVFRYIIYYSLQYYNNYILF
jgi:hypothetical protein